MGQKGSEREERKHKGRKERGRGVKEERWQKGKRRDERGHRGTGLLSLARNIQYNQLLLFHHQSGPHDNCPGF